MAKKNCECDDETVNLGYTEFWTAQVVVNGSKSLSLPRMRGELLWFFKVSSSLGCLFACSVELVEMKYLYIYIHQKVLI